MTFMISHILHNSNYIYLHPVKNVYASCRNIIYQFAWCGDNDGLAIYSGKNASVDGPLTRRHVYKHYISFPFGGIKHLLKSTIDITVLPYHPFLVVHEKSDRIHSYVSV